MFGSMTIGARCWWLQLEMTKAGGAVACYWTRKTAATHRNHWWMEGKDCCRVGKQIQLCRLLHRFGGMGFCSYCPMKDWLKIAEYNIVLLVFDSILQTGCYPPGQFLIGPYQNNVEVGMWQEGLVVSEHHKQGHLTQAVFCFRQGLTSKKKKSRSLISFKRSLNHRCTLMHIDDGLHTCETGD